MLTTLDFLYLTLGIGIIILVIVLTVALVQVILVMRDVRKITESAGNISEYFHEIVMTPLYYMGKVGETVGPYIEKMLQERFGRKK